MTSADRTWAARYTQGDVLQYSVDSKFHGIERESYATVQSVDARANSITVQLGSGETVTYDPRRLRGVNVFQEETRDFAKRDRIQFTSQLKRLGVANRDMGTIEQIERGWMAVHLDDPKRNIVDIELSIPAPLDHGYVVTSHSAQGMTATRVLAHFDTVGSRTLVNSRLAYVAISRASHDAQIFTNDRAILAERLSLDISKTSAIPPSKSRSPVVRQRLHPSSGHRFSLGLNI